MERFCKFSENVYDGNKIIWRANEKYLITYEDEKGFYFGNPIEYGIGRECLNKNFIIISR